MSSEQKFSKKRSVLRKGSTADHAALLLYRKLSIKRPGRLFNFRTKRGKGRLIDTRRLLEGGVYFLSKVTHSNHYRNKLTELLNSDNFHTTFAISYKLLIDEVV